MHIMYFFLFVISLSPSQTQFQTNLCKLCWPLPPSSVSSASNDCVFLLHSVLSEQIERLAEIERHFVFLALDSLVMDDHFDHNQFEFKI